MIFENLIDEYMEYDELDDVFQYHMYLLLMDNNHICKFLILEPKQIHKYYFHEIQNNNNNNKLPLKNCEVGLYH